MAKKKGNKTKAAKSGETSSIFPLLFLIIYAIATIFLVSQFVNKPFMEYLKGFRILWISLFWIYIGLLGYNMFSKLDFLKSKYMVIAFVVLVATGFLLRMNEALFFGGDSGLYLVLAKSLATFQGFQEIHMPNPIPHQYYGFGLPLILAPVFLFGLGVGAANFIIVLTSIGFTTFTFLVFRKYIRFEFAILITILVSFNWSIIYYSSLVMTELPFCFFMMMTIYFCEKYHKADENLLGKYLFISAGLAFFSYTIKPVGIGLVGAPVLYFLIIGKNWKKAAYFAGVFLIGFGLWNARIYFETGTLGYIGALSSNVANEGIQLGKEGTEGFGFLGNLFLKPFKVLFQSHSIFVPSMFQFMWTPNTFISILLTIILYVGFAVKLLRHRSLNEFVTVVFFYGIVMYAYILEPSRYYLPLLPFIYFYFFSGLEFLFSKLASFVKSTRKESLVSLAVLSICSLIFVPHIVLVNKTIAQDHKGTIYSAAPFQEYYEMAVWLKENVPDDTIIASRLDKEMFILTGIKGVNARVYPNYDLQWTEEKGKLIINNLQELIRINNVDYYVLDNTRPDSRMTQISLARDTKTLNEMFTAVYRSQSGQSYVLKVRDEWKKNN